MKMDFYFLQILFFVAVKSYAVDIETIIDYHFEEFVSDGVVIYLCPYTLSLNRSHFVEKKQTRKHEILSKNTETDFLMNKDRFKWKTFLKMGVVLDLTCKDGLPLLRQSSEKRLLCTGYRWLLWSESYQETVNTLEDMNLSIDSDVTLVVQEDIYDIYKVHYTQEVISRKLDSWVPTIGSSYTSYLPSRDDFKAFNMTAAYSGMDFKEDEVTSIEIIADRFYHPEYHPIMRYSMDWLLDLNRCFNFSWDYYRVNGWGIEDDTGNWSDMIGEMQWERAEIGMTQLVIRPDRLNHADYMSNSYLFKVLFFFIQLPRFGTASALISPFSGEMWMAFGFSMVVLVSISLLFTRFEPSEGFDNFSDVLEYSVGNITQQGSLENLRLHASRIKALTAYMFSFFLINYYNAMVLTGLLAPTPNSITDLNKLLDSDLRITLLDVPFLKEKSEYGYHGPFNQRRERFLKKIESQKAPIYFDMEHGLQNVRSGKVALLSDNIITYRAIPKIFNDNEICNTYGILYLYAYNSFISCRKRSPYKEVFAKKLMWMEETGLKKYSYEAWLDKMPPCQALQQTQTIGYGALTVAYIILLLGFTLALFIFIIEIKFRKS